MKLEGTQNIPSEFEEIYSAALTKKGTNNFCKKRSPFYLPKMQAGGAGVTPAQKIWRGRFIEVASRFKGLSQSDKARWYNALPPDYTDIGYYNFYVLSSYNFAILKFLEVAGVINSIQFAEDIVPVSGGKVFTINSVDTTKTVVVPLGNSYIKDTIYRGKGTVLDGDSTVQNIGGTIDTSLADVRLNGFRVSASLGADGGVIDGYNAIIDALSTTQITIKAPYVSEFTEMSFFWEIIEKKARVVFPIIKEINATSIKIDWSEQPDLANRVSIQVIEYI